MPTLVVLQGLPCSGKSTYAKELARSKEFYRVNFDSLHESMFTEFSPRRFNDVIDVAKKMFTMYLDKGYDIVLDNTNVRHTNFSWFVNAAKNYGYVIEYKQFDVPIVDLIERNRIRNVTREQGSGMIVPDDVIVRMASTATESFVQDAWELYNG